MNTFTVEYYTKSDGKTRATIEANTSAEAESIARQRDDFSQLITTRKEPATMTTPTPQPDRITAAEIRELFAGMREQIESLQTETGGLRTDIETLSEELYTMRNGLQQAATAPATTDGENFTAVKIEREKRKGKYYYKMIGGQYSKHGITIWDEVLEALGLDAVEYDSDDIHKLNPPVEVHVSFEWYKDPETGEQKKRKKITGRA